MRRIALPFALAAALGGCGSPQPAENGAAAQAGADGNAGYAEPLADEAAPPREVATRDDREALVEPSFDCTRAATDVERMICAEPRLAALDRDMAAAYRKQRRAAGGAIPTSLAATQRAFLAARDACDDAACVADAYRKRASGGFDGAPSDGRSCSAEIGQHKAKALVDQCVRVSPATHPPCNVANSCAMIRGEIERSCALFEADDPDRPGFCGVGG